MKKLCKLQINSEKLMNNDELVTLRGGYGSSCCVCLNGSGEVMGYMAGANQDQCDANCAPLGWDGSYGPWTYC